MSGCYDVIYPHDAMIRSHDRTQNTHRTRRAHNTSTLHTRASSQYTQHHRIEVSGCPGFAPAPLAQKVHSYKEKCTSHHITTHGWPTTKPTYSTQHTSQHGWFGYNRCITSSSFDRTNVQSTQMFALAPLLVGSSVAVQFVREESRVARRKEAHKGHVLEERNVGRAAECLVHGQDTHSVEVDGDSNQRRLR